MQVGNKAKLKIRLYLYPTPINSYLFIEMDPRLQVLVDKSFGKTHS